MQVLPPEKREFYQPIRSTGQVEQSMTDRCVGGEPKNQEVMPVIASARGGSIRQAFPGGPVSTSLKTFRDLLKSCPFCQSLPASTPYRCLMDFKEHLAKEHFRDHLTEQIPEAEREEGPCPVCRISFPAKGDLAVHLGVFHEGMNELLEPEVRALLAWPRFVLASKNSEPFELDSQVECPVCRLPQDNVAGASSHSSSAVVSVFGLAENAGNPAKQCPVCVVRLDKGGLEATSEYLGEAHQRCLKVMDDGAMVKLATMLRLHRCPMCPDVVDDLARHLMYSHLLLDLRQLVLDRYQTLDACGLCRFQCSEANELLEHYVRSHGLMLCLLEQKNENGSLAAKYLASASMSLCGDRSHLDMRIFCPFPKCGSGGDQAEEGFSSLRELEAHVSAAHLKGLLLESCLASGPTCALCGHCLSRFSVHEQVFHVGVEHGMLYELLSPKCLWKLAEVWEEIGSRRGRCCLRCNIGNGWGPGDLTHEQRVVAELPEPPPGGLQPLAEDCGSCKRSLSETSKKKQKLQFQCPQCEARLASPKALKLHATFVHFKNALTKALALHKTSRNVPVSCKECGASLGSKDLRKILHHYGSLHNTVLEVMPAEMKAKYEQALKMMMPAPQEGHSIPAPDSSAGRQQLPAPPHWQRRREFVLKECRVVLDSNLFGGAEGLSAANSFGVICDPRSLQDLLKSEANEEDAAAETTSPTLIGGHLGSDDQEMEGQSSQNAGTPGIRPGRHGASEVVQEVVLSCGRYRCPMCNFSFENYRNVLKHMATFHYKNAIMSDYCGQVVDNFCPLCNSRKNRLNPKRMYLHIGVLHKKVFEYMDRRVRGKLMMIYVSDLLRPGRRARTRQTEPVRAAACPLCKDQTTAFQFRDLGSFLVHVSTVHFKRQMLKAFRGPSSPTTKASSRCAVCSERISGADNEIRASHAGVHHGLVVPCLGDSFESPTILRRGTRQVREEQPFSCPYGNCGDDGRRNFSSFLSLWNHIVSHNYPRLRTQLGLQLGTTSCPLCHQSFLCHFQLLHHLGLGHKMIFDVVSPEVKAAMLKFLDETRGRTPQAKCPACPATYPSRRKLLVHASSSHFKEELQKNYPQSMGRKCTICSRSLDPGTQYLHYGVKHEMVVSMMTPAYRRCLTSFRRGLEVKEEEEASSHDEAWKPEDPPVVCGKCDEKFANHYDLLKHASVDHFREELLEKDLIAVANGESACKLCSFSQRNLDEILAHVGLVHVHHVFGGLDVLGEDCKEDFLRYVHLKLGRGRGSADSTLPDMTDSEADELQDEEEDDDAASIKIEHVDLNK